MEQEGKGLERERRDRNGRDGGGRNHGEKREKGEEMVKCGAEGGKSGTKRMKR